jgi:Protein of unknown function (DUF3429)
MNTSPAPFPKPALILGYAGLIPPAICVALLFSGEEYRWFALTGGFGYAALIFSFLGGLWWGQAVERGDVRPWIYGTAIAPSLIAFCLYMPWALGWEWPAPQLVILGLCIAASPLVDRKVGDLAEAWMRLRWRLSLGLGLLTMVLGFA